MRGELGFGFAKRRWGSGQVGQCARKTGAVPRARARARARPLWSAGGMCPKPREHSRKFFKVNEGDVPFFHHTQATEFNGAPSRHTKKGGRKAVNSHFLTRGLGEGVQGRAAYGAGVRSHAHG